MASQFQTSLQIALERLDRPQWADDLYKLVEHFEGIPEYDIGIEDEILDMLLSLTEAKASDPDIPVGNLMAIRLAKLESWTKRAYKRVHRDGSDEHTHWNPIEEHFSSFRTEDTKVTQAATAYPPEDIIKRWCRDTFR